MATVDVDVDGTLDVVTGEVHHNATGSWDTTVVVSRGLGDTSLAPPSAQVVLPSGGPGASPFGGLGFYEQEVGVADLVGSPALDVVAVHTGSLQALVYPGNGDGTLGAPTGIPLSGGPPSRVQAGDVTNDGRADLVIASRDGKTVTVVRNLGGGAFGTPTVLPLAASDNAYDVVLADIDGANGLDIVAIRGRCPRVCCTSS